MHVICVTADVLLEVKGLNAFRFEELNVLLEVKGLNAFWFEELNIHLEVKVKFLCSKRFQDAKIKMSSYSVF